MVLWLDFVICLCYVCSLVCTLLSLFLCLDLCMSMYWSHPHQSPPTQYHPPTRSFSRGHTADSLPTCVVVTEGGFTKFPFTHFLVVDVTEEASPGSHRSLGGRTADIFIQLSHFLKALPSPKLVSCWGQPQAVPTPLVIVNVLLILIDLQIKGKKCCGKRLDLIIDYLFDDETFVFFSSFFCLFTCMFFHCTSVLSVSVMCVSHCMSVFVNPPPPPLSLSMSHNLILSLNLSPLTHFAANHTHAYYVLSSIVLCILWKKRKRWGKKKKLRKLTLSHSWSQPLY